MILPDKEDVDWTEVSPEEDNQREHNIRASKSH